MLSYVVSSSAILFLSERCQLGLNCCQDVLEILSKAALGLNVHPPFRYLMGIQSLYKAARRESKSTLVTGKPESTWIGAKWRALKKSWLGGSTSKATKTKILFNDEYAALLIQTVHQNRVGSKDDERHLTRHLARERMLQRVLFQVHGFDDYTLDASFPGI